MPSMTMVQAIQDALRLSLREDPRVLILGEDVGRNGGVFRVTEGLQAEFGETRVCDTPLAENGIVGGAIGLALRGMRPVAEIQFVDFIYPAFDQIVSELSKMRWRSAGQYSCPVVIRAPYGGGIKGGLYHSQSPEAYFCHTAGLSVVIPSTPTDAKGLLLAALAGDDPVIFLEPKRLYRTVKEDVPEGRFVTPLSSARIARAGEHVTILAYGAMVQVSLEAAAHAAEQGWSVEVVDLRTLVPLDQDAVIASVQKTGRVVIVHEAPRTGGYGAELAALIAERALTSLQAPVLRVTGYDTPFPYTLEHTYLPDAPRVLRAIEHVMRY
ncbi:MAG TPA: alpha-ketoacid dehydrogenase subunit beta [Candidatus Udaeobacter sp.]|jgi:2-oxoisovalerate dehydrogenase E1 component beta subunit|nr:alpha-ketoacid dehydrogenase subunit beta [Candidatus Udaeobacter sp.]